MNESRKFIVSKLGRIYHNNRTGKPQLSMAEITGQEELNSFGELRDYVHALRYPDPQSHKLESYGWVPTLFMPSDHTFKTSQGSELVKHGSWRTGAAEANELSVFVADVDNANPNQPIVTLAEVAERLNEVVGPLPFFLYTSFSHTPAKPKFRVVIETDRDISRGEMLRLGLYLNWTAFGQQADLSIYDPGDFLFAPPYQTTSLDHSQGMPLDVAATLAKQVQLQVACPESVLSYLSVRQPKAVNLVTTKLVKNASAEPADLSVRPNVSTKNRDIFNPVWAELYREKVVGGSHWKTMRSVLGMVWAKNGGDLTYGELDLIFREIDATAAVYFETKYGEAGITEMLTWLMDLAVEAKPSEWHPILEREETGLIIQAKDGECGEGKTHDELKRIVREKGRYIYVVPKIENMEERRKEFREIAGDRVAYAFTIKDAHSRTGNDLRVPLQLVKIRSELDRLPAGKPIIVFVTQQGAMQMDWSRWSDFEIIFDEVPEVFTTTRIKAGSHADLIREHVQVNTEDGDCYRLGLTAKGRELAASTDIDDYDSVHYGLTLMMAKDNTYVWVKKEGWDCPTQNGAMEFFAITSPLDLMAFKSVRMLGDEMLKSVTAEIWSKKWDVKFESIEFDKRKRTVPTKDRVTICYFAEHRDSSLTRFREGDIPLTDISEFIAADAGAEPVLWTCNEAMKGTCKLPVSDLITPKSHGRNDLQHYKRVAWLAAMKASKFEISSVKSVCGMTNQELTDWREYNALFQMVMRSNLRDFDSAAPVTIYVFSRKQADYLQRRLGGTIKHIPDIVIDVLPRTIDPNGAMTCAERGKVKYWRDRMRDAGVSDVLKLAPSAPLAKLDERMVGLINTTARRAS